VWRLVGSAGSTGWAVGSAEVVCVRRRGRAECVCVRARSVCVECVSVAQRPFERRIVCACVPLVSSKSLYVVILLHFVFRNLFSKKGSSQPSVAIYKRIKFVLRVLERYRNNNFPFGYLNTWSQPPAKCEYLPVPLFRVFRFSFSPLEVRVCPAELLPPDIQGTYQRHVVLKYYFWWCEWVTTDEYHNIIVSSLSGFISWLAFFSGDSLWPFSRPGTGF